MDQQGLKAIYRYGCAWKGSHVKRNMFYADRARYAEHFPWLSNLWLESYLRSYLLRISLSGIRRERNTRLKKNLLRMRRLKVRFAWWGT